MPALGSQHMSLGGYRVTTQGASVRLSQALIVNARWRKKPKFSLTTSLQEKADPFSIETSN